MILCQCVGVTDVTIKRLIEEGAASITEITRRCGAGRCCSPCREEIAALLYNGSTPPHNLEPHSDDDSTDRAAA